MTTDAKKKDAVVCKDCFHYGWLGNLEFCYHHKVEVKGDTDSCGVFCNREKIRQWQTWQDYIGKKVWRAFLTVGTPSIRVSEDPVVRVSMDKDGVYFELSRVDGLFRPGEIFRTKEEALDDLLRKFTEQIEKLKGMDP